MTRTTNIQDERIKAFIEKHLKQLIRYEGRVMTHKEYYNTLSPHARRTRVRTHENRKINLEYRKLKNPVTEHYVCFGERSLCMVPKIMYDHFFNHLPEEEAS